MAIAIGGPTPGYIRGCNVEHGQVDPVAYCRDYEVRVCARERAAGRIDDAMHTACVAAIETQCAGRTWGVGCNPTQASTQACLLALVDIARLHLPATALPECMTVCSGGGGGFDPEGI
jgi:hypothetical protein